jgi:hypothetical protein
LHSQSPWHAAKTMAIASINCIYGLAHPTVLLAEVVLEAPLPHLSELDFSFAIAAAKAGVAARGGGCLT